MSSLVFDIGAKKRAVARFMEVVRHEVQKAVAHEKETRKLTQQQIADMLDTTKSVVNREILGGNLTLRRLAELAWALGWEIVFEFREPVAVAGQNQAPDVSAPPVQAKPDAKVTSDPIRVDSSDRPGVFHSEVKAA
jgi:hypothetical protein